MVRSKNITKFNSIFINSIRRAYLMITRPSSNYTQTDAEKTIAVK